VARTRPNVDGARRHAVGSRPSVVRARVGANAGLAPPDWAARAHASLPRTAARECPMQAGDYQMPRAAVEARIHLTPAEGMEPAAGRRPTMASVCRSPHMREDSEAL